MEENSASEVSAFLVQFLPLLLIGLIVYIFYVRRRPRMEVATSVSGSEPGQTTRLLCGNAFLGGKTFYQKVLDFYENKYGAVAPEFGIDIKLVVGTCIRARTIDARFDVLFATVLVFWALLSVTVGPIATALAVVAVAIIQLFRYVKLYTLACLFQKKNFNTSFIESIFVKGLDIDLLESLPRKEQNLVIYTGFTPFVGAGLDLGGWSFITFINKPKIENREDCIKSFTIDELYEDVDEKSLFKICISGLNINDYYFVRSGDAHDEVGIVGDPAFRPTQVLHPTRRLQSYSPNNEHIRHYKSIQVVKWGGDLIVSHFLRCVLQGESLFVEMKHYVLPPLAENYRRVDLLAPRGVKLYSIFLLKSLLVGPFMAAVSPLNLAVGLLVQLETSRSKEEHSICKRRRKMLNKLLYSYGASNSLRSMFSGTSFSHFFQKSDVDFADKLIERKVLDEIICFLDRHGIDSTDIRDRRTTILNSGILVQGGDVRAESLAVGKGAQATKIDSGKAQHSGIGG